MAPPQQTSLTELAAQISMYAKSLTDLLAAQRLDMPSFAPDAPPSVPNAPEYAGIQMARMALIDATETMRDLALGPDDHVKWMSFLNKHDLTALQVVNEFNIPQAVPLDGEASFAEIAAKVGLPEAPIRRIIRHAMICRIFCEPRPGYVAHTAASAVFLRTPEICSWVGHNLEEVWPASVKIPDALRLYGDSEEPGESAFNIAFGLPKEIPFFRFVDADGEGDKKGWRMQRFSQAMKYINSGASHNTEYIHAGFDWKGLGGGTVVDVGGSTGHVSVELAKTYPSLKCVVQDFPALEARFNATVPDDLKSRVTFQGHDFFTPQPIKGAAVYFFCHILHDWSDTYAIKILQNTVPAMKNGSKLIAVELVQPPPGSVPRFIEKICTSMDLQMMGAVNSKERTSAEWTELFKRADPRFSVKDFVTPPGAAISVIEVVFCE